MSRRSALLLALSLMTAGSFAAAPRAQDKTAQPAKKDEAGKLTFTKDVAPIFAKYCITCHGGKKPKGDFVLDKFKTDDDALKAHKHWEKVVHQLRTNEMPPPGRPKPSAAEMDKILAWIETDVLSVDCTKTRNPGRVTIRRLNKNEYRNTIRDLVGVDYKPAEDFPSDDVGYGFDNIGDVLTLSPLLLEKYLAAAEQIVALTLKDPAQRERLLPDLRGGKDGKALARPLVAEFARRAYRRPVDPDEVERLLRFVDLAERNKDTLAKGVELAYRAALVSPHFIFRVERTQRAKGKETAFLITEFELANRLSYFLWSSMPDEELFRLAGEGKLRQGDTLARQVRRMLADPKAKALTKNFAGQWLQLRNLETKAMNPDKGHFPQWDEKLRASMVRETELFFEHIVKEDRSVLDFLDGDYTFVNERLARHYGMKDIKGDEYRKVSLAGTQRRGVLTQGSILTVTSNPSRTSPVKRGKWVLDNILNAPPPPAPPDVPELEEGKELKGTLRQRMEQHRVNPTCATCHQRMDPIGFGFENFDGIGAWRTQENKLPIDSSGTLPSGQSFKGPVELVSILKSRSGEFRRCIAEKLLTYAMGRGLENYDKCALDDICTAMTRNQDRFSSLVLAVVNSEPFQKRKGR